MPSLNAPPSRTVRRQPSRHAGWVKWAKRGAKLALLLAVAGVAFTTWRSGRMAVVADGVSTHFISLSAASGFRIENVEVVGREQTDPKALLAAAGLKRGDPILAFSPEAARQRIESLSWVASAAVERRLPDTIAITIVERKPIALWQHNDKFALIDSEGRQSGPGRQRIGLDPAADRRRRRAVPCFVPVGDAGEPSGPRQARPGVELDRQPALGPENG